MISFKNSLTLRAANLILVSKDAQSNLFILFSLANQLSFFFASLFVKKANAMGCLRGQKSVNFTFF